MNVDWFLHCCNLSSNFMDICISCDLAAVTSIRSHLFFYFTSVNIMPNVRHIIVVAFNSHICIYIYIYSLIIHEHSVDALNAGDVNNIFANSLVTTMRSCFVFNRIAKWWAEKNSRKRIFNICSLFRLSLAKTCF